MLGMLLCLFLSTVKAGYVTVSGSQLMLDGRPFYFAGFNAYWLIESSPEGHAWFLEYAKGKKLTVGRTWAFNSEVPRGVTHNGDGLELEYNEDQLVVLDSVLAEARKHNIKMILALGNLWRAYKGPEHFFEWATGRKDGTVLDFYRDSATKALYKQHIDKILNRVNTINGYTYKDDDTIMAWDVLNEPRCPGCLSDEEVHTHESWLKEMSAYVKGQAPNQLVTLALEGMFNERSGEGLHLKNPGAGVQCEGEDWAGHSQISHVDFTTLHLYERHVEMMPVPEEMSFKKCNWECIMNWMSQWVKVHEDLARRYGKPLIIEETGTTNHHFPEENRKQWFQYVFNQLIQNKNSGGPLAGVMLWNAVAGNVPDVDGYNIYIDQAPQYNSDAKVEAYSDKGAATGRKLLARAAAPSTMRRLSGVENSLDGFRRGQPREQCAVAAASWWRPAFPLYGTVDLEALALEVAPKNLAAIIVEATNQL